MSNPETEPKPIIGDDGELLEADISFPRVVYVEVPIAPAQPPVGIRMGKWLFYAVVITAFSACVLWSLTIPSHKNFIYQYEPPIPTDLPVVATQFAQPPSYFRTNLEAPVTGLMLMWNSHLTGIHDVSWSADQSQFAISYGQNLLAIWSIKDSQYTVKKSGITGFDWSSKNAQRFVVSSAQTIDIYESSQTVAHITTMNAPSDFVLPASLVRWSIDGSQIAALSQDQKTIAIFDAANGDSALEKHFQQPISDIHWSPTKPLLIAVQPKMLWYIQPKSSDFAQVQQEWTLAPKNNMNWKMAAFAPDGSQVALTGHDCDAHIAVFNTLQAAPNWVKRVGDYEPQLCSSDSQTVVVWSPTTTRIAGFIQGDDTVYIWDSATAKVVDRITPEWGRYVASIAWSHDGRYLTVSTNSMVAQWALN